MTLRLWIVKLWLCVFGCCGVLGLFSRTGSLLNPCWAHPTKKKKKKPTLFQYFCFCSSQSHQADGPRGPRLDLRQGRGAACSYWLCIAQGVGGFSQVSVSDSWPRVIDQGPVDCMLKPHMKGPPLTPLSASLAVVCSVKKKQICDSRCFRGEPRMSYLLQSQQWGLHMIVSLVADSSPFKIREELNIIRLPLGAVRHCQRKSVEECFKNGGKRHAV